MDISGVDARLENGFDMAKHLRGLGCQADILEIGNVGRRSIHVARNIEKVQEQPQNLQ